VKPRRALFVGRFQPFHKGHLGVVKRLSRDFDIVIIGIGSAQYSHTNDNPFTASERQQMISKTLEDEGINNIQFVLIEDLHDYPKWVSHVVKSLPDFEIVYTNDELCHELFNKEGCKAESIELFNPGDYSGRKIRQRMANGEPWEEFVPKAVKEVLTQIDGVRRIKKSFSKE
jgi:nicotinamide-nucleotide adenylyltransferase